MDKNSRAFGKDERGFTEITNQSFLRSADHYSGKDRFGYGCLDVENAPTPSEGEWGRYLFEERVLRQKLKLLSPQCSMQEAIQIIVQSNLQDELKKWAEIHLRNKAIQMKKGIDILITPATQFLLAVNSIIQKK